MVRHKNRYFVMQLNPLNKQENKKEGLVLKPSSLHESIQRELAKIHGDFGVAACRAGFTAKYCNAHTRIAIVRVRHGPHRLVASVLPLINTIGDHKATMTILYIGASLKCCFKFIKNFQQQKFNEYCINLTTDEEKAALKEAILNLDSVLTIV